MVNTFTMETCDQRLKNYIEYYEQVAPIRRYSLSELLDMNVVQLLDLMPPNQVIEEHSEAFGCNTISYIAYFQVSKTTDNKWNIGYYENNNEKLYKNQQTLFEVTYSRNLKFGLIDLFLMTQNRSIENFNGIKSGRIKINLSESWDNREELGFK